MVGGGTNKLIEGVIVLLLVTEFEPCYGTSKVIFGSDLTVFSALATSDGPVPNLCSGFVQSSELA